MNADRADKKAKHWWNFLALHPKEEFFFFNSFRFTGLTEFIMNDNKKNINRIFYKLKKFNVPDNKLMLVKIKFSIKEHEKIKRSYNFSETTVDVTHLINSFEKCQNINDEVKTHMVDDTLQMAKKDVSTLLVCKFI